MPPRRLEPRLGLAGRPGSHRGLATATGEAGVQEIRLDYVDPDRDIGTPMAFLGMEASDEASTSAMIQQSRLTWRPQFTAAGVNAYIRDGFTIISPQK